MPACLGYEEACVLPKPFILFFSCISNCAFSLVRTLNADAPRLTTPPIQIIIHVNIIHSVSPVIGRSNAHAWESMFCLLVVPVVFFTLVRCCVQFCIWDLIRLYIVLYCYELCFIILYTYILLWSVMLQGSRFACTRDFSNLSFGRRNATPS